MVMMRFFLDGWYHITMCPMKACVCQRDLRCTPIRQTVPSGIIRWPLSLKRQTSHLEMRPPPCHIAVNWPVSRLVIGTAEEKPNPFLSCFPHERSWRMIRGPIHYPCRGGCQAWTAGNLAVLRLPITLVHYIRTILWWSQPIGCLCRTRFKDHA
jgi:hypothetical protein